MVSFSKIARNINKRGFTLIELIVVVTIIGVLFVAMSAVFNPFAQIQKANNATRQQDLNHIKTALDTYFNDTGCYPTSLSFGSQWKVGSTIYMEKIPEDPSCSTSSPTSCYIYQTNNTSCPQWNILYAQMHAPLVSGIGSCIVATASNCLPSPGGLGTYNYCAVSGKLDCAYLSQNALPTPMVPSGNNGNNGGNSGGGNSPTATPTPAPITNCNGNLSACSNGICNVEAASQCTGCGGTMQCYNDLVCGSISCGR